MSGQRAASFHSIRSIIRKERDCRWRRPALACSSLSLRSQSGGLAWCSFSSSNRRLAHSIQFCPVCLSRGGRRVSLLCFHFLPHPEGCPRARARLSPRLKCNGELGRWLPRARQVLCQCCQVEGFISDQLMRMGDALSSHAHVHNPYQLS